MYPNQLNCHSPRAYAVRGFTLIELIMVIVIMGVLAVFAAPRMFNTGDFYAQGFHDETLGLLRYAQKTAVAQRRTVCVTFTSTTAKLTIASAAASNVCNTDLIGPYRNCPTSSGSQGCITAQRDVVYTAPTIPTTFSFDGLGQPSVGQSFDASSGTSVLGKPITVESVTGYVHD